MLRGIRSGDDGRCGWMKGLLLAAGIGDVALSGSDASVAIRAHGAPPDSMKTVDERDSGYEE